MAKQTPKPATGKISPKEKHYLRDQLRLIVNHSSRLMWILGEVDEWEEIKKAESDTTVLWQAINAFVHRYESRSLLAGNDLPPKLDLMRRMAIALEVHGIDPFELEKVKDATEADRKVEALRRRSGRRKAKP